MGYRYLFFILLIVVVASVHYLFYLRVVKKITTSSLFRRLFGALLAINLFCIFGYLGSRYLVDIPNFLYFTLSLSVGIFVVVLLGLLLYESINIFCRILFCTKTVRYLFDIIFVFLIGLYLYEGVFSGSTTPKIVNVDIDQKLFERPYKIAQISDVHIGALLGKSFLREIVEKINREDVDLVAITGDLVDMKIDKSRKILDELKRLKSRYGTFYVVGNHEYYHGVEKIISYMKSIGVNVLENSSKKVDKFYIVGVYDRARRGRRGGLKMDIEEAYKGVPKGVPTLLLMHRPSGIKDLKSYTPSLILSGHTHGGQIWPFGYFVKRFEPYIKGVHKLKGGGEIYINSGVGFWGPPMRVGTQSEITIIKWR